MKRSPLLYVLPAILFVIFAAYVLIGENSDMLYTAQDRNEFFTTGQYLGQYLDQPFGLMAYLGSYLTQFFYHPALGATMLILLWIAIYFAIIKAFSLGARWACLAILPLSCLLTSVTDLGYWIYIMPFRGYWFAQSLALLCVLLMLWAARQTPQGIRLLWCVVGSVLGLPLLGWTSYLFALCFFVTQCAESRDRRMPLWQNVLGLVMAIVVPLCYARFLYTDMHIVSALKAGLPYFESTTVASLRPSYPFIILVVIMLLMGALLPDWRRFAGVTRHSLFRDYQLAAVLVCSILMISIQRSFAFDDYNYQAEMRMNQAAMEDDWDAIIHEAEVAGHPSRTMVVLKNIALMNTGELGSRSFMLENSGLDINNPDSLNLNTMQIAAPVIYLQYGKVQFATRWCMENAVGYGFSPYYMKMFVRAAQECGEHRLERRYYDLLSLTTFHADWRALPSTMLVRDLHVGFSDVIDGDNNDLERYLIENFSLAYGSEKPLIKELNLFYAMIYRDPKNFWPAFYAYASMTSGANLPTHYQEAYLIMQENYPIQLPFKVQITPMVNQSYQLYKKAVTDLERQGISEDEIGKTLRDSWKHTYWWYIMYGRKVY